VTITTIGQIIIVMFLWAVCFPLITLGIEFAPHLTFATLRAVIAGLALTALAIALRRPWPQGRRIWTIISIVGVGATSFGFFGMFHAAEFVSPGIATVIANTQPLMAAVLAGVLLNERLTARGKIGLLIGFVGILVISSPQLFSDSRSENYAFGITYILLAALGITVSNVLIKKIAGSIDVLMAMGLQMLIGSIPLAVAAWATEEPTSIRWSFTFIVALVALSLFGTALVYWLWFSVLAKAPLNRANAYSFLVPIFGLAMGVMFYEETLGWSQLVGIILAIVGVTLVTRRGTIQDEIDS
tara:strand:- start:851 stop:1747 length:897 start_codon:yes stop_codon:yes gene_type:complete